MSVELCPTVSPGDLYAFGSILTIPFVLGLSTLCGLIIDTTGSYLTVFVTGATLNLVALLGFALIVREPRTDPLYVIKPIDRR
jgi:hypothetical protein